MKHLLICLFVIAGFSGAAQKMPEHCNGLPYAKVDVKADLKSDVSDELNKSLPKDLKKGSYEAMFKCFVTCKGQVESLTYHQGNLPDDQQKWLMDILNNTNWKAAIKDDTFVTSTVFVKVTVDNGKSQITTE